MRARESIADIDCAIESVVTHRRDAAHRSGVVGAYGEALKVRVAAPANDGKANAALVRFLATHLGVPPRSIEITAGHHDRTKVVEVRTDG